MLALAARIAKLADGLGGIVAQALQESHIAPGAGHDSGSIPGADLVLIGLDQHIKCCWIDIALLGQDRFQRLDAQFHIVPGALWPMRVIV